MSDDPLIDMILAFVAVFLAGLTIALPLGMMLAIVDREQRECRPVPGRSGRRRIRRDSRVRLPPDSRGRLRGR